jgi:hypothetical protein
MHPTASTTASNGANVEPVTQRMTRAERDELTGIVKLRARVARANVETRKAELLADFEEQIATRYQADDARWAEATATAERAVAEANAQIAAVFAANGIPSHYQPHIELWWTSRGENHTAGRRTELRRVAVTRLEAQARAAKLEIDRAEATLRTELAASGLQSGEARAWLDRIPAPEQLLPRLDVEEEVRRLLQDGSDRRHEAGNRGGEASPGLPF